MTEQTSVLSDAELNQVSGGDRNYKECSKGTTAGGSPGLYPWYANCSGEGLDGFGAAVMQGGIGGGAPK